MHPFSSTKFRSLSKVQQHSHCAELLRTLYEEVGVENTQIKMHYSDLRSWMGLDPCSSFDTKSIADEYHRHLSLSGRQLREHNLLPSIVVGDRKEQIKTTLPAAIYLDKIRSAHNVGSIIRTTEAFALGTLYFSPETPTPSNKQVRDAAMGAHDWIKYQTVDCIDALPRPLIALETSLDAIPLHDYTFPETFTLTVGNEEYGCSEAVLKAADAIVTIPLSGRKNSLNVANAFAIAAAEVRRQYDEKENF